MRIRRLPTALVVLAAAVHSAPAAGSESLKAEQPAPTEAG